MNISIVAEPSFVDSTWGQAYRKGISQETSNQGFKLQDTPDSTLLVIGSTLCWLQKTCATFQKKNRNIILLSPYLDTFSIPNTSSIGIDYQDAMQTIIDYLREGHKTRTALVGANPQSVSDMAKEYWFHRYFGKRNIFWNLGNIKTCCKAFLSSSSQFDSAICTNDLVAMELFQMTDQIPMSLELVSFGDSASASHSKPSLTSFACDYVLIGKLSVKMAMSLNRNKQLGREAWTVKGKLEIRESTNNRPYLSKEHPTAGKNSSLSMNPYWIDVEITELQRREKFVSALDSQDLAILSGIQQGQSYELIAEQCGLSPNTVKYRLQRMKRLSGFTERRHLLYWARALITLS